MPADTGFAITVAAGLPVVAAPREVDSTNGDALRTALLTAIGRGDATVVVDMGETAFCDTAGLNVLVRWHQRLSAEGGELRLVIRDACLARLFSITGIESVIPIFATLDDALSELPAIAIRTAAAKPDGIPAEPGSARS